jgi:multiple sugar transport system permease protein
VCRLVSGTCAAAEHRSSTAPGRRDRRRPRVRPQPPLVLFFSFVSIWNNFFLPYAVIADSTKYPIQVGLSHLLSSTPSFNPAVGGGGQQVGIFRPELALATLLAVVPISVVFMLSQRALVRGLVGGGVKG